MSRFSEKRTAEYFVSLLGENTSLRKRRGVLVAIATLFGGLIGNFYFNRIDVAACLWTLTLLALADLLLSVGKLSSISGWLRYPLDITIVGVVWTLTFPIVRVQYGIQHAALNYGVLHPVSDGQDHSKDPPLLQVGTTGAVIAWRGKPGDPMIHMPNDKIKIYRDGNEIKFSTTVRDQAGNLIVEIVDNHWRVSTSENNCWDKNYNKDSLEVKDGRGRVVLQVRILPKIVQLQVEYPQRGNILLLQDDKYSTEDGIKPRFKYPSREYWAQLDLDSGYPLN